MRCSCCNRQLNEKEINWNDDLKAWEMCGVCLEIAYDAAFSNGFRDSDKDDDDLFIVDEEFDDDGMIYSPLSDWIGGSDYDYD